VPGPLMSEEFAAMLDKGLTGKPDTAYPLDYFLANIEHLNPKKRVKFADKVGAQGQMLFKPEGLVFREDPSTLFAANGTKITGGF